VHLLRDLHDLREDHPDDETVATWTKAVRALYDQALAVLRRPPRRRLSVAERRSLFTHFEERARQLGLAHVEQTDHPCHTIAHRLLHQHGELCPFVRTPGSARATTTPSGVCGP